MPARFNTIWASSVMPGDEPCYVYDRTVDGSITILLSGKPGRAAVVPAPEKKTGMPVAICERIIFH